MDTQKKNWCAGKKIGVIGGDLRQLITAKELCREGLEVALYAIDTYEGNYGEVTRCVDLSSAVKGCDAILLPLPLTQNGYSLYAPLSENLLPLTKLFATIERESDRPMILGGRINERAAQLAQDYGFTMIDYFCREELQIANAVPTSEGAVAIAMNRIPYTLHSSPCTVLGFGRIGKMLAATLHALGAIVKVVARKEADFAWISAMGCEPVALEDLPSALEGCRVLFNTVPTVLISEKQMAHLSPDTLLIDLASERGIDEVQAKAHGNEVIWALSLPGKTAPATAGHIIKNSVMNLLKKAWEAREK